MQGLENRQIVTGLEHRRTVLKERGNLRVEQLDTWSTTKSAHKSRSRPRGNTQKLLSCYRYRTNSVTTRAIISRKT